MNAPRTIPPKMLAERIPLEGTGAVDIERQREVVARCGASCPSTRALARGRHPALRVRRPDRCTASCRWWWPCRRPRTQVPRILKTCRESNVPVVPRGAGTGLSGGALPHRPGRAAVDGEVQAHPAHRPAGAHRGRAARRAQRADLRSGCALRPVLRARSVEPDRVHHRRQRRRELRRRALPQVRPDACTTCCACAASRSMATIVEVGSAKRSTRPGYDLLALVVGCEGMLARGHRGRP